MILKNNNSKAIDRISKRILKRNKAKNSYIISAIILTTLLLTFIFTAGLTFYKSYSKYISVSETGIESDGEFRLSEDQYEKLKKNKDIVKSGFFRYASEEGLKNRELLGRDVILKAVQSKEVYEMQFIKPIEGNFPKNENEALVPTWVIESLGGEVNVGEELTLEIPVDGEIKKIKIIVSGYYEPLIKQSAGLGEIFVTNGFIEKNNKKLMDENGVAYVELKGVDKYYSLERVEEKLRSISKENNNVEFEASGRYKPEKEMIITEEDYSIVPPIVLGALLIVLSGYLLIYNVFYIAVIRETRFYGQLKTLGATKEQIKKIIYKNAFTLSLIAIPIGLVLGYLLGVTLTPEIFKYLNLGSFVIIDKSIFSFILSTIFSLVTVYISCRKPGKIAAKVSPIEAIKYNSGDLVKASKKIKEGRKGAKIYKMALANMIKSKRRVIISALSIAISATIVIFAITISLGLDTKEHVSRYNLDDITVQQNIELHYGEEFKPLNSNIIQEIKALDGVESVNEHYSLRIKDEWGLTYFKGRISLDGSLKDEFNKYEENYMFNKLSDRNFATSVSSIKSSEIKKEVERLNLIDGKVDPQKFESGKYIIINRDNQNIEDGAKAGDKVKISFELDGEIITQEFEIMAIVGSVDENFTNSKFSKITIEEEKFKSLFKDYKENIMNISIGVKDGYEKQVEDEIRKILIAQDNNQLGIESVLIWEKDLSGMKTMIITMSVAASIIFGIIAILNVINTIVTTLITRKREFAILEAIGMTKKQQKKLLVYEGLYYLIISMIIIIPLGLLAALLTPNLLPIYGGFNVVGFIIAIVVIAVVVGILMTMIPLISYKIIRKMSLVERIKED